MAEVPQFPRRRRGQFLRTPGDTQTEGDTQLIREMEQRASAFDGLNQLFGRLRDQVTRTNQQEMERETRLEAQEAGAAAGEKAAEGQRLTQRMVELTDPDGTKETHVLPPGVKPNDLMFVREGDVEAEVITETTEGFQPTELPLPEQEGTIWSETYRAHAINTYVNRTEVNAQRHAQEVFQENQNDPEAFRREYDSFVEGIAENLPPEVESEFLQSSERVRRSYMNEARQNRASINRNRSLQSTQEALESTQQQVFNSSRNALGNEQSTADVLDGLQHYRETLARQGPSNMSFSIGEQDFQPDPTRTGNLDVQEINELYNHVESKSKELMITGRYDRLDSFKERSDYVAHVTRQVQFPERESELDFSIDDMLSEQEQMDVVSELNSRLKSDQQQAKQAIKMDFDDVKDMTQTLKDGDPLSTSEFRTAQNVLSRGQSLTESGIIDGSDYNDVRENFEMAWATNTHARNIRTMPIPDLINARDIYRSVVENPDSVDNERLQRSRRLLDVTQERLDTARVELNKDPMNYAHNVGFANVSPIQLPSLQMVPEEATGEEAQEIQSQNQEQINNFQSQIRQRIPDAVEVANHYGTPLKVLRDSEQEQLQEFINNERTTVEQRLSLASAFQRAIPQDDPAARNAGYQMLSEISGEAGIFANNVGLYTESEQHRQTARRVEQGRMPDEAWVGPAKDDLRSTEASQQLREALGNDANIESVQPLFNTLFQSAYFHYKSTTPVDEKGSESIDEDRWRRSLQAVSGRVTQQDGTQLGGFIDFRGVNTVLPMNMSPDKFRAVTDNFSEVADQLGDNPLQELSEQGVEPFFRNGERMTPEDLEDRGVQFVFAGDGRYNLKVQGLGYVAGGGSNGLYEMDIRPLADINMTDVLTAEDVEFGGGNPRAAAFEMFREIQSGAEPSDEVANELSDRIFSQRGDIMRQHRMDQTPDPQQPEQQQQEGPPVGVPDQPLNRLLDQDNPSANQTVGQRNNNPGNLKFADQPGAVGQDNEGHARFESVDEGWEALKRQIQLDADRGDTIQTFVQDYAEGNQDSYISFLSEQLEASPTTPIEELNTEELGRAVVFFENGKTLEELR